MKSSSFILFLLLSVVTVYAQENNGFLTVKLYNQSSFLKNNYSYQVGQNDFLNTEKSIHILSPKFAIAYTNKNGNTHELELSRFELNFNRLQNEKVDSPANVLLGGQETTNLNLALRYEYTPSSKKSNLNSKGVFSVAYGLQPYLYNRKTMPLITTNFPESNTTMGVSGYIAPRYTYRLSEKLFLDINIPFYLIDANLIVNVIEDPTKSKSERNSFSLNSSLLPMNYNLRIGLAYRI